MGAGEWITIAITVFSALGIFAGAVWWMSALYSRVCSIDGKVDDLKCDFEASDDDNTAEHRRIWQSIGRLGGKTDHRPRRRPHDSDDTEDNGDV